MDYGQRNTINEDCYDCKYVGMLALTIIKRRNYERINDTRKSRSL